MAYDSSSSSIGPPTILPADGVATVVEGAWLTNTTYAALSMRDGDAFAKQFGGPSGADPDWFLVTITGYDGDESPRGTVDFYLADFRFEDSVEDYIVDQWTWVDLVGLGPVSAIDFALSSSDNGDFGMNTPAYFALDGLRFAANGPLLGDLNGDGQVDGLDVEPFVGVLLDGAFDAAADMNEDTLVNGLDVDPFVAAVIGGTNTVRAVPEPSLIALLFGAGLALAVRRTRCAPTHDQKSPHELARVVNQVPCSCGESGPELRGHVNAPLCGSCLSSGAISCRRRPATPARRSCCGTCSAG